MITIMNVLRGTEETQVGIFSNGAAREAYSPVSKSANNSAARRIYKTPSVDGTLGVSKVNSITVQGGTQYGNNGTLDGDFSLSAAQCSTQVMALSRSGTSHLMENTGKDRVVSYDCYRYLD